jgi:hypothetical protein
MDQRCRSRDHPIAAATRIHFTTQQVSKEIRITGFGLGSLFEQILEPCFDSLQSESIESRLEMFNRRRHWTPPATLS